MIKMITGNEAVALGALRAGVKSASGYPGTPSTGALTYLLTLDLPDTHVEWSTNEKVALEIATGVAWGGHRALCTMKMSGVNVAYDTLISVAYSGIEGGLVIYVADDPGANAGMCEQDSRGFAYTTDLPMLEPSSVADTYRLTQYAFELSEVAKTPVFIRLGTSLANSFAEVDVEEPGPVSQAEPLLIRDINRFNKAGAKMVMDQHLNLIDRLEKAKIAIQEKGLNPLQKAQKKGGLGIIASGVTSAYLEEGFALLKPYGLKRDEIAVLKVASTNPIPTAEITQLMGECNTILVLEELEPYIEREVYVTARRVGYQGTILGKMSGLYRRVGEYGVAQVVRGIAAAQGLDIPDDLLGRGGNPEEIAAVRPITVCAGCPHRGTYMSIISALRKLHLKQDQVMVAGDIGCTILGMNPPFNIIWNEISMGASVSLAQGFVRAGVKTPVIATIGDSTFFHAGIPGLVNAVQHQANLTLIIMDNYWTAMTGMQVNPGTPDSFQKDGSQVVDLAEVIPALGVRQFFMMDPFDLHGSTDTVQKALKLPGVKVILSRRECAIQSARERPLTERIRVIEENCNLCKLCVMQTGCSALSFGENAISLDVELCRACGLCVEVCNRGALVKEAIE
jgi:indolepyruvate ferredoxin oxidoreductase, alpha subunit